MAEQFDYKVVLVDATGNKTAMSYDLGTFDTGTSGGDFDAAVSAANQIRGALVDVTDANVFSERLINRVSDSDALPVGENIIITEEASVIVHLNAPGTLQKLHRLRIPAPTDAAVFLPDSDNVGPEIALLVQYVQQVAQHSQVSDGESIDTTSGPHANGIADPAGGRITKGRKLY